jgi:hypothetical protein
MIFLEYSQDGPHFGQMATKSSRRLIAYPALSLMPKHTAPIAVLIHCEKDFPRLLNLGSDSLLTRPAVKGKETSACLQDKLVNPDSRSFTSILTRVLTRTLEVGG